MALKRTGCPDPSPDTEPGHALSLYTVYGEEHQVYVVFS